MEIEDLKNIWDAENPELTPEISIEKQKELHLPLEKLRRNMRIEFWINILSIILLIPLLYVLKFNIFMQWTLYFVLLFIVFYFTFKFYQLYKKIRYYDLSTKNQLLELKYELNLNVELYKSYYVASVPFFMGMLFLYLEKVDFFKYDDLIMHYAPFIMFFALIAIVLAFGSISLEYHYGKYVKQIIKILKDLN
jgi:hypothetical protein